MGTARPAATLAIHGPIGRSDLPGLYHRACTMLQGCQGGTLVCDVTGVTADAVAVDALARLALAARRRRCQVQLRGATAELRELVELMGMGEVLLRE